MWQRRERLGLSIQLIVGHPFGLGPHHFTEAITIIIIIIMQLRPGAPGVLWKCNFSKGDVNERYNWWKSAVAVEPEEWNGVSAWE